jgi:hypothetical protein
MYSVQAVAGGIFFLAVAGFGWIAIRLATYPAPWSLPWQKASIGGPWAPINATIRFAVLAGVTVVAAWPYFQGGAPVWGNNSGGGWGIVAAPVHRASGDLTWLLIVLAVAGAIAVGLLVVRLLPARRRRQRTAPSRAPVANEVPTLSELTDETLKAMTSERDPLVTRGWSEAWRIEASHATLRRPHSNTCVACSSERVLPAHRFNR